MKPPSTRHSLAILLLASGSLIPSLRALEIDSAARERLGLRTAALEKCAVAPTSPAFGSVISPATLIDLLRQRETAKATADLSKEALARAEKLFTNGELVARKDVDAARSQQLQDQAVIQGLEDRISLEWGSAFTAMPAADQASLIKDLLERKRFLVRMTASAHRWTDAAPAGASLYLAGRADPLHTETIYPATTTDPAFQTPAFLAIFTTQGTALPVGATASGALDLLGQAQEGVLVPESAVVFFESRAWIFRMHGKDHEFERIEIPIDHPVAGGWYVSKEQAGKDEVVISGAQVLLSQEALANQPAEEE
ncbi:hypothetical protein [Luteolibacter soli]|uniref:Uncharacterized protein n=1 Tax=Luteolibacter soli TaxID=3135280 RepID=A0ABU9B1Z6_9BACT